MPSLMTVTGNLQDLTGANNAGYVLFDLINFGDRIPRVIGTTNVASRKILVAASGSGAISTNLWGNDNIDPAGTLYYISVMDTTKVVIQSDTYQLTGSSANLNSISPTPAPPSPSVSNSEIISVTSPNVGDFTQAHTLNQVPSWADVAMTSGGFIYFQATKFDASNLYLTASDVGVTADIFVYKLS